MLKQSLQQKLLQKLSPQQIQLMKLLQLPAVALEQRIKEELETNPALEEGDENEIEDDEFASADDAIEKTEGEENKDEVKDEQDDFSNNDVPDDPADKTSTEDFDIDDYIQDDDVPYYKTQANNHSDDDERFESPVVSSATFQESLLQQLGLLEIENKQYTIATHLIGSLDEDGYLRRDLNAIVNDLVFTQNIETNTEELLKVLKIVQGFDPAGIGARDLQECLLLQLERKPNPDRYTKLSIQVIKNYMEEFSKKHYEKIADNLNITDEDLKEVIHEIIKLNPRPGGDATPESRTSQHIIPDFLIANNDGRLDLSLNSRNAPELRINREYSQMIEAYSKDKKNKSNKDAVVYLKQKIDSAKWFIDAILQRQLTLLKCMEAIMNYQYEYFRDGDETKLKPMILKDIAEIVGMDISTVSRVANSKYVQTPFGTFLLKTFFSESLSTDSGEEVSSREVKKILSDAIAAEDKRHPLPDDQLTKILQEKGYNIARRTVAKYREQLNLPVARLRKEL